MGCARSVSSALSKIPSVASVTVDFKAKTAKVEVKGGGKLSRKAIEKALPKRYAVTNVTKGG